MLNDAYMESIERFLPRLENGQSNGFHLSEGESKARLHSKQGYKYMRRHVCNLFLNAQIRE